MEDVLRNRVVGQDHVVTAVSDAVRMSRAGLQAPNRPVASFLFLGPTGVGKVRINLFFRAFQLILDVNRRNYAKLWQAFSGTTNTEDCEFSFLHPKRIWYQPCSFLQH